MNTYQEPLEAAAPYRQAYRDGLKKLIAEKAAEAETARTAVGHDVFLHPEVWREKMKAMLGWPLTEPRKPAESIRKVFLGETMGRKLYRVTYEILPGVPFTGLLFLTDETTPRPLVLSQHGGLGTPEGCSSIHPDGTYNYNEMTKRLLRYDVNVFAPQLLLWRELDGRGDNIMDGERKLLDSQLKALGGSITAVELYALQVVLDELSREAFVDAARIGMAGLSYGGMYTLLMTALDTRIQSSVSSCFFGAFSGKMGGDWSWPNECSALMDAEYAALCWPRRICLQLGQQDPLILHAYGEKEYARLLKIAGDLPVSEKLSFFSFRGQHEFSWSDEPIETMMQDLGAGRRFPALE